MAGYHLGVNLGRDRAAALVTGGDIVVAIEQERLDRYKHSIGFLHQAPGDPSQIQLPDEAISYCLKTCGITLSEVVSITANMPGVDYSDELLRRQLPPEVVQKRRCIVSHHLAHAYSAYWPSGFDEALILVADAQGTTDAEGTTESYSVYQACGTEINLLHAERVPAHLAALSTPGAIYEYISRKAEFVTRVGSQVILPESSRLMDLAAYGNEQENWHCWFRPIANSYHLDISAYDIFLEVAALEKRYDNGQGQPCHRSYLVDLARKVQSELEQAMAHLVRTAVEKTGIRKLCLAGEVALNGRVNHVLLNEGDLEDIFIFPAAGDAGVAAGCALWSYARQALGRRRARLRSAAFGRSYDRCTIERAVEKFAGRIHVEAPSEGQLLKRTAQMLAGGHIVARFEKGSEYGPRALGHRSILADPSLPGVKGILNARVKFREPFSPFALAIPEEVLPTVLEQQVALPYMLLVSPVKAQYRDRIPAVTHHDGTARVQIVTLAINPFLYRLCHELVSRRGLLPMVLNTSFSVASEPTVESPEEAIEAFLNTGIDYLCLEDLWVSKRNLLVESQRENPEQCDDSSPPQGLPPGQPAMRDLMQRLDRALYAGDIVGCPWSIEELYRLSSEGARYKETSRLFQETSYGIGFRTHWSSNVVCILDPLGRCEISDRTGARPKSTCTLSEAALLQTVLGGSKDQLDKLRINQQLSSLEWEERVQWSVQQLARYRLKPHQPVLRSKQADTPLSSLADKTLAPFADEQFSARETSGALRATLTRAGYSETRVCELLGIGALQQLEPTLLHYYDQFLPQQSHLADLIRLFLLRAGFLPERLKILFGSRLFDSLIKLGVVHRRRDDWASAVSLYCADALFIATDHHDVWQGDHRRDEQPVMGIGSNRLGLVYTAPRYPVGRALDLCTGAGIQALVASRYANEVVGVDDNPRAIRFARFNASLNGIDNARFVVGDLYTPLASTKFDIISANPLSVASHRRSRWLRDGGAGGEELLSRIVSEAGHYLTEGGKLHIVADIVNAEDYQKKLDEWWSGGPADKLVLQTADQNQIKFAVAPTHAATGHGLGAYNAELEQWVASFRQAKLESIRLGYIYIHRLPPATAGSYYFRTIHNPNTPIHEHVKTYFEQRQAVQKNGKNQLFLRATEDLRFRIEFRINGDPRTPERRYQLFVQDNPYYTTYTVNEEMFRGLELILRRDVQLSELSAPNNQGWILDLIYKGLVHVSPFPVARSCLKGATNTSMEPARVH